MLPFTIIRSSRLKELHALQAEVKKLRESAVRASAYINKIEQGYLNAAYYAEGAATQAEEEDLLAISLQNMRHQMKIIEGKERERNWATKGLARFVEILRTTHEDTGKLYDSILTNLVKYIQANQGGLFIVEHDESTTSLDMVACYAYERKKYLNKRILTSEGLVGQCYLEAETLHITQIPESYIRITSGLGDSVPQSLLIVPLKINDQVYGVVELASFHTFSPYQIEFIEKLGESIASAIASAQISIRTRHLLAMSQAQTEQLRTTEEEIRQNVEELEATQEEMRRNEAEMTGLFDALNRTLATIEFDIDGVILKANDNFLSLMGYTLPEIQGKHHRTFVDASYAASELYTQFWQDLKQGMPKVSEFMRLSKTGQPVWMQASYTPVRDVNGKPYKVIKLAQDITAKKQAYMELRRLSLVADNTDNAVIITNKDGFTEYVNKGFVRMTGYTLDEIKGKKPGALLQGPDTDQAAVARIREQLASRTPFYEEILNYNKDGNAYWTSLAINPVFDDTGKLEKFIAVQAEITQTKLQAVDFNSKLDAINKSNGVIEFDTDGTIITANDNFLNLMGYSLEEVKGKHHRIFVDEQERQSDAYQSLWDKLGKKGEFIAGEFRRFAKDGREVWLRGSYTAVLDFKGRPLKIIKLVQDITEQKLLAAELQNHTEELRAQEEEVRQNMEELVAIQEEMERKSVDLTGLVSAINFTMATIEFDIDGVILKANDNFLSLMGYTLPEIQGKHHRMFTDDAYSKSREYEEFWKRLKNGEPQVRAVKRYTKSGNIVWLSASYTPVFNTRQQPIKVIKFAQLVTEAEQRELKIS